MKRFVLTTMILVAVILGGAVAHASTISSANESHVLPSHHLALNIHGAGERQHHVTSAACAYTCFGTVASFQSPIESLLGDVHTVDSWVPVSCEVQGQFIDPAEHPPKSI